jgi:hypothetical protein
MLHTAMPMNSDQIHDDICADVSPAAWPAWKIKTSELVQPVIMAMNPATTAESEESASGRNGA